MGLIRVTPEEIAAAGEQITMVANDVDAVRQAITRVAVVPEPKQTAGALHHLQTRFVGGLERMRGDIDALGRGAQASSTLYTHTDATAMTAAPP